MAAVTSAIREVIVMMGSSGYGMGIGGWLVMGLVGFAVVGLAVWLLLRSRLMNPAAIESPAQILDRRFATGEIDEPTYTRRRAALDAARTPTAPRA